MPYRSRPRSRVVTGFIAAAISALTAFGATVPARASAGAVLRVGVIEEPRTLNVAVGTGPVPREVWNLSYARLTSRDADALALTSGLAVSWQPSDGGRSYTYTLRDGVRWSDGEPLTAADVAYTINRANKERWAAYDEVAGLSAEVIDHRTVVVSSQEPDPRLPALEVPIVPRHVYEPVAAESLAGYPGDDGVGSGPFTVTDWKRGDRIRLDANPRWWGGASEVGAIEIVFFDDAAALLDAVARGEVDFAEGLPSSMIREVEQKRDVSTITARGSRYHVLSINTVDGNAALRDVEVRRAISTAVDRDSLVSEIVNGVGTPQSDLPASLSPQWARDLDYDNQTHFDPLRARAILDEAGYVDSDDDGTRETPDGSPIELRLSIPGGDQEARIAKLIAGWLGDVGIGVEVRKAEQLPWDAGAGERFDLALQARVATLDPDAALASFVCPEQLQAADEPARWCDDRYDQMYRRQHDDTDATRRHATVEAMLQRVDEQVPAAVLFVEDRVQAYRTDRFKGWVRQPEDVGPVLFGETSPSYLVLEAQPAAASSKGAKILVAGALMLFATGGAAATWLVLRRRAAPRPEASPPG